MSERGGTGQIFIKSSLLSFIFEGNTSNMAMRGTQMAFKVSRLKNLNPTVHISYPLFQSIGEGLLLFLPLFCCSSQMHGSMSR